MTVWYALRVPPRKEFAALETLNNRGYVGAVPYETRYVRNRGRRRRASTSYHPHIVGYVLLASPGHFPWDVLRINVIQAVVAFSGAPAPIAHHAVERLMRIQGRSVPHVSSVETRKSLTKGDAVWISNGPFRGRETKIEDITGCRAKVILDLFGTPREITVALEALEAA